LSSKSPLGLIVLAEHLPDAAQRVVRCQAGSVSDPADLAEQFGQDGFYGVDLRSACRPLGREGESEVADQGGGWIQMEFIFLIPMVLIAVLVVAVTWSRRGQSSIGRESGDTLEQIRRREKGLGGGSNPPGSPGDWTF
jgi:hypothetical protein